jgi:hypothetical protein
MSSSNFDGVNARKFTVEVLTRIATPVLTALSEGKLHATMPVECLPGATERDDFSHLEAMGRLLAGMAPWLELGTDTTEEGKLRGRFIGLAVKGITNGVDPQSPDYMNFSKGWQPLVDSAFLAHSLLRAPKQLWGNLDKTARANVATAFKATRIIPAPETNWLLFAAMVEVALWEYTGECEMAPIAKAMNKHLEWYKGDGAYGDGAPFHWDYYNSFVIQPMLIDVLRICAEKKHPLGEHYPLIVERARRYAAVQERMISPEATFPLVGRSCCYRFGAFQLLSQIALERRLPEGVTPAGVRSALTAVVRRMIEAPGTFDTNGWLQLGAVGHQPLQAESYISTGSLYLCAVGLLHLGLPPDDAFWTEPNQPWTQQRLWSGENLPGDHAIGN